MEISFQRSKSDIKFIKNDDEHSFSMVYIDFYATMIIISKPLVYWMFEPSTPPPPFLFEFKTTGVITNCFLFGELKSNVVSDCGLATHLAPGGIRRAGFKCNVRNCRLITDVSLSGTVHFPMCSLSHPGVPFLPWTSHPHLLHR